jgi:hypothetical protein
MRIKKSTHLHKKATANATGSLAAQEPMVVKRQETVKKVITYAGFTEVACAMNSSLSARQVGVVIVAGRFRQLQLQFHPPGGSILRKLIPRT